MERTAAGRESRCPGASPAGWRRPQATAPRVLAGEGTAPRQNGPGCALRPCRGCEQDLDPSSLHRPVPPAPPLQRGLGAGLPPLRRLRAPACPCQRCLAAAARSPLPGALSPNRRSERTRALRMRTRGGGRAKGGREGGTDRRGLRLLPPGGAAEAWARARGLKERAPATMGRSRGKPQARAGSQSAPATPSADRRSPAPNLGAG